MTMSRIARLGWHSPLIRGGFETSRGERGIGRDGRRTYLRFFWMMVVLRGECLCNGACWADLSTLGRKLLR
jgi:hypothetical protein